MESAAALKPRLLATAYAPVLMLAALETLVGVLAAAGLAGRSELPWPALINILLFGTCGTVLIVGGARDLRVRLLGAVFLLMAAAFADPVHRRAHGGAVAWLGYALRAAPPESFFAAALWLFVRSFPRVALRSSQRLIAAVFVVGSVAVGVLLFTANVALEAQRAGLLSPAVSGWTGLFDRHVPTLAFWPLVLGAAVPALPYLVWKSRFEEVEEKRRVSWFVGALAIGFAPMLLTVIVAPFIPALADPERQRMVGAVLYLSLASIVPATMYAVAVHRLMDVQLIVRRTIQYALARYAVWVASIGPLSYLTILMYMHRDLTFTQFLTRGDVRGWLLLPLIGFGVGVFRQQLLRGIDRRFFRTPVDSAEVLARLDRGFREVQSIREIAGVLTQEVDRAIHPKSVAVLIVSDDGSSFVSFSDRVRPLSAASALADLLRSVHTEIQLEANVDGPVTRLLPPPDREWLKVGGFQLLSPLVGSDATLLGLLALGESRSQLPYTKTDRMVVSAMSGHAAMRLENQRVRELPAAQRVQPVNWQNEPGACCVRCFRMWPTETTVCACGGPTESVALPLVLHGKFRVERRIGAGGMGVVYAAIDMALDRRVAIKTLPMLTPDRVASLQREARVMASVLHPSLAMIFAVETWRGIPLLVVEYLEGGTLADRLDAGGLPIPTVIAMGLVLADALDRVHASGILHLDIKPSNIGFSGDGAIKLLDFGLAAMLDRPREMPSAGVEPGERSNRGGDRPAALTSTRRIAGTPMYLSPEAARGQPPTPSFDLWSLSLVLYEAVAGTHPFAGIATDDWPPIITSVAIPDVRVHRRDCPHAVAEFLRVALSPRMEQRPQTAAELRNQLRQLQASLI